MLLDRIVQTQRRLTIAFGATLFHGLMYGVPNRWPLFTPVELPLTPVDRLVPLIPATAWIYWSDYLLVFIAFQRTELPARFMRAFVLAVLVAVGLHYLVPTIYPRELFTVPTTDVSFTARLFVAFRDLDAATSCMPSLHVAVATLAALAVWTRKEGSAMALWAALIAVSTLTTKQHYAYDVAAGGALGALAWKVSALPLFSFGRLHEPSPHPS